MKRFLAWLITLFIVLFSPIAMCLTYIGYAMGIDFLLDKVPILSNEFVLSVKDDVFNAIFDALEDATGIYATGISGILVLLLSFLLLRIMVKWSSRICPSRQGGRYLFACVISVLIALGGIGFLIYLFLNSQLPFLTFLDYLIQDFGLSMIGCIILNEIFFSCYLFEIYEGAKAISTMGEEAILFVTLPTDVHDSFHYLAYALTGTDIRRGEKHLDANSLLPYLNIAKASFPGKLRTDFLLCLGKAILQKNICLPYDYFQIHCDLENGTLYYNHDTLMCKLLRGVVQGKSKEGLPASIDLKNMKKLV